MHQRNEKKTHRWETTPSFLSIFRELVQLLLSRFSRFWLFATPWTAAYQAPPSTGFSRQEYRSGLPMPSSKILHCSSPSRFSRFWLFATPRTAAYQAPPSTGFSRQEYRSGLPLPSPKILHCSSPFGIPILYNLCIHGFCICRFCILIFNQSDLQLIETRDAKPGDRGWL